jgi:transcriptional regulator with XRE-family HTH domain
MFREYRIALGISQSKLARLSNVSRFKICTYELGSGSLSPEELGRIRDALESEADRLRDVSAQIDFGRIESGAER